MVIDMVEKVFSVVDGKVPPTIKVIRNVKDFCEVMDGLK